MAFTTSSQRSVLILGARAGNLFNAEEKFLAAYREIVARKTTFQEANAFSFTYFRGRSGIGKNSLTAAIASGLAKDARNEYRDLKHFLIAYHDFSDLSTIDSRDNRSDLFSLGGILYSVLRTRLLLVNIGNKIKTLKKCLKYLRKSKSLLIRLQYIARETHNRISESPAPIKKEPPIGGVKVGGEQCALCHAA